MGARGMATRAAIGTASASAGLGGDTGNAIGTSPSIGSVTGMAIGTSHPGMTSSPPGGAGDGPRRPGRASASGADGSGCVFDMIAFRGLSRGSEE